MSDTETPDGTPETPAQEQPAKPEIDWKAKAREWESRAKANKAAADRLAEIEEAQKTETQKAAERLAVAEQEAVEARREALRLRIAARFSIGDDDADLFLTGSDEETLTRQAERLSARITEQKKQGNAARREGGNPTSGNSKSDEREFVRSLFGNVD